MKPIALIALALVLSLPSVAAAEEPSTGTPWIVSGSLLAGAGVVDLALAPGCALTHVAPSQQVPCALTAVLSGAALVAVGTPLLGVGMMRRGAWLEHLRAEPRREGLTLGWGGTF